jgi:MFS family permease
LVATGGRLGYLAEIDHKGRYVVASGAMQTGGMALGPAIAGTFVAGADVSNSLWVGVVCFTLAILLFLPIMFMVRQHSDAVALLKAK